MSGNVSEAVGVGSIFTGIGPTLAPGPGRATRASTRPYVRTRVPVATGPTRDGDGIAGRIAVVPNLSSATTAVPLGSCFLTLATDGLVSTIPTIRPTSATGGAGRLGALPADIQVQRIALADAQVTFDVPTTISRGARSK